jgi:hypothetical protein
MITRAEMGAQVLMVDVFINHLASCKVQMQQLQVVLLPPLLHATLAYNKSRSLDVVKGFQTTKIWIT